MEPQTWKYNKHWYWFCKPCKQPRLICKSENEDKERRFKVKCGYCLAEHEVTIKEVKK